MALQKKSRGRPRTLSRGALIEVAMKSYWEDGPLHVSVNEICRRASVSKPGLYREFGSEDGLKKEALLAYQKTVLSRSFKILEVDRSFDESFKAIVSMAVQDRDALGLPKGCLYHDMKDSRDKLGFLTQGELDLFQKKVLSDYEKFIDRAKLKNQFRANISSQAAAVYIDAQVGSAMRLQKRGETSGVIHNFLTLAFSVFI